jgi:hypothetical protein
MLSLRKALVGFTLVELMVTTGLVSVTALATAQLLGDMSKGQANAQAKSDFLTLVNFVNSALTSDLTCSATLGSARVDLTPSAQSSVLLTINGLQVGNGSSYGATLTGVRVYLTAPANLSSGGGNQQVTAGSGSNAGTYFVAMGVTITANKRVGTVTTPISSVNGSTPLSGITVQVASNTGSVSIQKCGGLRLGSASNVDLPSCSANQVLQANGVSFTCVNPPPTSCPTGYMPSGAQFVLKSDGTINTSSYQYGCVSVPTCGASQTLNPGLMDSQGRSLQATITQVPIPVMSGQLISKYDCGFQSCPAGAAPQYNSNGVIISCLADVVPMLCVPTRATLSFSTGKITYSNWTCPTAPSASGTATFCGQNCSTLPNKVGDAYFPNIANNGTNHTLASCLSSGGHMYFAGTEQSGGSDSWWAPNLTLTTDGTVQPTSQAYGCKTATNGSCPWGFASLGSYWYLQNGVNTCWNSINSGTNTCGGGTCVPSCSFTSSGGTMGYLSSGYLGPYVSGKSMIYCVDGTYYVSGGNDWTGCKYCDCVAIGCQAGCNSIGYNYRYYSSNWVNFCQ